MYNFLAESLVKTLDCFEWQTGSFWAPSVVCMQPRAMPQVEERQKFLGSGINTFSFI